MASSQRTPPYARGPIILHDWMAESDAVVQAQGTFIILTSLVTDVVASCLRTGAMLCSHCFDWKRSANKISKSHVTSADWIRESDPNLRRSLNPGLDQSIQVIGSFLYLAKYSWEVRFYRRLGGFRTNVVERNHRASGDGGYAAIGCYLWSETGCFFSGCLSGRISILVGHEALSCLRESTLNCAVFSIEVRKIKGRRTGLYRVMGYIDH